MMDNLASVDDDVGRIFSGNTFEQKHCRIGNKHEVDKFANSGIIKVQQGDERSLLPAEKKALKAYRRVGSDDDNVADERIDGPIDVTKMFDDKIKAQKSETKRKGSRYINTDFVLASAAIVERLWSKADAILCQRRQNLNPVVVECLLFLKENRVWWNIQDVKKALEMVKRQNKSARLEKKLEEESRLSGE
jgi:transcription initiation factor IIF auxiliary subunit